MSRRLAVATGLVGAGLLLHGAWIPAKAALAQVLLERAWARARTGEPAPRPWPWADTWPVARLEVPRLGVRTIVLAGATGRTLAFGPGHLAGSAEPGAPGHSVFAGHRDTHFAFLRELRLGEVLHIETRAAGSRRYRVVALDVVHEQDTDVLDPSEGATLSLITCWPFDTPVPGGALRLVARAEAI